MKIILHVFLVLVVSIMFCASCNKSPNEPEKKEDILPQRDVPWPSLADSPWPMYHHDPQSTGRSNYLGPTLGIVENKIPLYGIEGSLILDNQNNIYITNSYPPIKMQSFSIQGDSLWSLDNFGASPCTPLLGKDSTIYVSSGQAKSLFALNYDGTVEWEYKNNERIFNLGLNIGLDGTLYFIDESGTLKAISKSGQLLWKLTDSRFQIHRLGFYGVGSFSPDSKFLYIQGNGISVLAINTETHLIEWTFGDEKLESTPIIDNQGNLYFINNNYKLKDKRTLYSINDKGNINWRFDYGFDFQRDNTEPTIDYNGNIYFGIDTLYSVNYKGELRWNRSLDSKVIVSPLVSDIEGNIYIGTHQTEPHKNFISSYDSKGNKRWELEIKDERILGASAAITNDGRLIFPSFKAWNIIIIK